jgi:hypothetical protein
MYGVSLWISEFVSEFILSNADEADFVGSMRAVQVGTVACINYIVPYPTNVCIQLRREKSFMAYKCSFITAVT